MLGVWLRGAESVVHAELGVDLLLVGNVVLEDWLGDIEGEGVEAAANL